MLTLISPSKTLDLKENILHKDYSVSNHLADSKKLINELQKKSPDELSLLMGLSEKLSNLNFQRNMNWEAPTKPSSHSRQAIFAFKGDVYLGFDVNTLKKSSLKFAQKHLRILSGLYGLLRPLDLIEPYRLEMGTKLNNERGKNLYQFWGNRITKAINEAMIEHNTKILVNLASVEYFTAVRPQRLAAQIISPVFKDFKNGNYKIISFYAKKARGLMARYITENAIDQPDDLRAFNLENYMYSKRDSSELFPVFLRKNLS